MRAGAAAHPPLTVPAASRPQMVDRLKRGCFGILGTLFYLSGPIHTINMRNAV